MYLCGHLPNLLTKVMPLPPPQRRTPHNCLYNVYRGSKTSLQELISINYRLQRQIQMLWPICRCLAESVCFGCRSDNKARLCWNGVRGCGIPSQPQREIFGLSDFPNLCLIVYRFYSFLWTILCFFDTSTAYCCFFFFFLSYIFWNSF